ncbi:NR1I3 protein, partial [Semnornis frantzii]|nr:NR1I3 protein [Semnornis frantzii]
GSPCPPTRPQVLRGQEEVGPSEDKVCAVCGDRASGYHFHVMTCEGCKGFFRWGLPPWGDPWLPCGRGHGPVTKAKRRQCQACRLQKCFDVGMRKDSEWGGTGTWAGVAQGRPEGRRGTWDRRRTQGKGPAVRLCIPSPRPQSPPEPAEPSACPQQDCLDPDVLPDVFSMLPHF